MKRKQVDKTAQEIINYVQGFEVEWSLLLEGQKAFYRKIARWHLKKMEPDVVIEHNIGPGELGFTVRCSDEKRRKEIMKVIRGKNG